MADDILKNIWNELSSKGKTDSEFDAWKTNVYDNEDVQNNVYGYLKDNGHTDSEFGDWKANALPAKTNDSASADPAVESNQNTTDSKSENGLSAWQSIKNSFSNLGEQIYDAKEFWFDDDGTNASLDIASNAVASMIFGQKNVDKFVEEQGEGTFLTEGLGSKGTTEALKAYAEEKGKSKQTLGIIEGAKEGDVGAMIAGSVNAFTSLLGSVGYGGLTLGTGFFMDYAAENYIEFNKLKAENLGVDLKELIKSGEADTAIPVGMAAVAQGLEVAGLGTIFRGVKGAAKGKGGAGLVGMGSKYLAEKLIYNKAARATVKILATGSKEFTTEILQHAAEEVNKELGSVAGTGNEAEVGKAFIDAVTSQEGLEAGLQGFIGGSGLVGGTYSVKAMGTIRTAVDGDLIEKNIDALSVLRNNKKSTEDATVAEGIQKEIDLKESEIADSVVKGNEIYESLNEGQIKEIETLSDLADVSAYKITELNKKLRRGDITEAEYELGKTGFEADYNKAKQGIIDMTLEKNLKFAKETSEAKGLGYTEFETTAEMESAISESKGSAESKQNYQDNKDTTAGAVVDGQLFINKEVAKKTGAINVGSHEMLHPILNALVGDANQQGKIVKDFRKSMTSAQRKAVDKQMKDRGYNTPGLFATEYINVFSDALAKGQINYDKNTFEKIGDVIVGIFKPKGFDNISFNSGKDVYNFVKEYNKSGKEGKLTSKVSEALGDIDLKKEGGLKAGTMQFSKTLTPEQSLGVVENIAKNKERRKASVELAIKYGRFKKDSKGENLLNKKGDKIPDPLSDPTQERLEEKIRAGIKPVLDKLITSRTKALYDPIADDAKRNVTRQEFKDSMRTDLEVMVLNEYDGSQELEKFIINRGYLRANNLAKRLGIESQEDGGIKSDVDAAKDIVATEDVQSIDRSGTVERGQATFDQLDIVDDKLISEIESELSKELKIRAAKGTLSEMVSSKKGRETYSVTWLEDYVNKQLFKKLSKKLGAIGESNGKTVIPGAYIDFLNDPKTFDIITKALPIKSIKKSYSKLFSVERIGRELTAEGNPVFRISKIDKRTFLTYFVDGKKTTILERQKQLFREILEPQLKQAIADQVAPDNISKLEEASNLAGEGSLDVSSGISIEAQLKSLEESIDRYKDDQAGFDVIQFSKSLINDSLEIGGDNSGLLTIQFSKASRKNYEDILKKKRPDLKNVTEEVDNLFKWVENLEVPLNKKSKYEKLALFYMGNGHLILPEDGYKVVDAVKVAASKKIDPFSFNNPNELLEKYPSKKKDTKINPDTVKTFSSKEQLSEGITIYNVENTKEGQIAVRSVIDSNWGEKSNPWCIAARIDNDLDRSFKFWKKYGDGKRIAFKNGKLLGFWADNSWWDRMDKPTSDLTFITKTNDNSGFKRLMGVNTKTGVTKLLWLEKGSLESDFYAKYNAKGELVYKHSETPSSTTYFYDNVKGGVIADWKNGNEEAKFEVESYISPEGTVVDLDIEDFEDIEEGAKTWETRELVIQKEPGTMASQTRRSISKYTNGEDKYTVVTEGEVISREFNGKKYLTGADLIFREKPFLNGDKMHKTYGFASKRVIELMQIAVPLDSNNNPIIKNPELIPFIVLENVTIQFSNTEFTREEKDLLGQAAIGPATMGLISKIIESLISPTKTGLKTKFSQLKDDLGVDLYDKLYYNYLAPMSDAFSAMQDTAEHGSGIAAERMVWDVFNGMPGIEMISKKPEGEPGSRKADVVIKIKDLNKTVKIEVKANKSARITTYEIKKYTTNNPHPSRPIGEANEKNTYKSIADSKVIQATFKRVKDYMKKNNIKEEDYLNNTGEFLLTPEQIAILLPGTLYSNSAVYAKPMNESIVETIYNSKGVKTIGFLDIGMFQVGNEKAGFNLPRLKGNFKVRLWFNKRKITKAGKHPISLRAVVEMTTETGNKLAKSSNVSIASKVSVESSILQLSKSINSDFNNIIEGATGIKGFKVFSEAKGKVRGQGKGKFKFFIPPSADDFAGLLSRLLGKGTAGDANAKWFKTTLFDPFSKGIRDFEVYKEQTTHMVRALKKRIKNVPNGLGKINETGFTNEAAVRVYLWAKNGYDISGLSKTDQKDLIKIIENNQALKDFANELDQTFNGYPEPNNDWLAGTVTTDIINMVNTTKREEFLESWQANSDIIFSKENINKLRAAYGDNYVEALQDMLYRMKTGRNRPSGANKLTNRFMNWVNDSVGTIMFFNTRSALLQTLSIANFINWGDNNPAKAAMAFANQKQFWADFAMLFNSSFLKQRRSGLKNDVNAEDIASAAESATNKSKAVLAALLKMGFLPTQMADSFAIAMGGASFIRNRINKYVAEGMDAKAAEEQSFLDFQEIAEETQQSSRPDRISQQQASPLGRIILAFANTPMQYMRLTKKAFLDLKNGRGDAKTNLSKIVYYTFIQNIIFSSLQAALFSMAFGDDEEDDDKIEKKEIQIANSMLDSILRGVGVYGAIASTIKNIAMEVSNQANKDRPDFTVAAQRALSISPPVDSKMRKLMGASRAFSYKNTREKMVGYGLDNPAYYAVGQAVSAAANIPLDRVVRKADNLRVAVDNDTKLWQSIALGLGYSQWDLDLIETSSSKGKSKWGKVNKWKSSKKETSPKGKNKWRSSKK